MTALHLIFNEAGARDCIAVAHADDGFVLLQDGVYAALTTAAGGRVIHVVADDVTARGIDARLNERVRRIDYDELVRLVESHQPIVSWGR